MNKALPVTLTLLPVLLVALTAGCTNEEEEHEGPYEVEFTVLYSEPQHVNNTTVYLDGEPFMVAVNVTVDIYPPILDQKSAELEEGEHEIRVTDHNYGLTGTKTFRVDDDLFVDVLIDDDGISIDVDDEPTGFK